MARQLTRGQRNVRWLEGYIRVPEGKHVGKPMRLRPWQKKAIRRIYDTPTRMAILSFGRKNGKTSLAAMLAVLHLVGPEARPNSQLYSDAQSREQAAIVFSLATKMIRLNPDLSAVIVVRESAKVLECPELGTYYRALSADATTAYGFSPVFVIHDELGQVRGPRSELFEALETAMGAHEAPLSIVISTQAPNDGDLLSTLIDDAATGADPRTKLFLWTAPRDADPWQLKTWKAANPALGDFRSLDDVRDQAQKARRLPALEAGFRNLILNQRVASEAPFVAPSVWAACGAPVDPAELEGRTWYLGVDLGMTTDLTAIAAACPLEDGRVAAEAFVFVPEEGLRERAERDRVPYDQWADAGHILTTPGATTSFRHVAGFLAQLLSTRRVAEVACDPWRKEFLLKPLEELGADATVVDFRQGFQSMAPAVEALERLLVEGRLRHGAHPVLTWQIHNVRVVADDAGNRKFSKRKSTARIDAIVALVMALARANQPQDGPSVYESRGIEVL